MDLKCLMALGLFSAGGMVTANLTLLMEVNPEFVAEWWKVGLHSVIAIFLAGSLVLDKP